jgi:iron complex transport system substrate-binding protein
MTASQNLPSIRPDTIRRIACLTEETTETLYRMGEEERIVGISAFTVRPARAKREKPVVCQFTKADLDAVLAVEPDLVLAFSDLQADICAGLIRLGVAVHCFNQRSVPGILAMIRTLGALVDRPEKGERLARELAGGLDGIAEAASRFPRRPRVYFEEWHDPMIAGIRWVAELVEIAGGEDCFPEFRYAKLARDRIVADPARVLEREPDVYLGSWCGRKFRPDYLERRPGWAGAPFLQAGRVHEIDASTILQPGPGALTDGVWEIHRILAGIAGAEPAPPPPPLG